jgi:predicted metal-dependent hydrolase
VQVPVKVLVHVADHELVQLEIEEHVPAFRTRLGHVLPDGDFRRERLRVIGKRLAWVQRV